MDLVAVYNETSCCPQMHTLRLLERLLAVDYASLALLRGLGLWDLVYSPSFFGFAEQQVHPSLFSLPVPAGKSVQPDALLVLSRIGASATQYFAPVWTKEQSVAWTMH